MAATQSSPKPKTQAPSPPPAELSPEEVDILPAELSADEVEITGTPLAPATKSLPQPSPAGYTIPRGPAQDPRQGRYPALAHPQQTPPAGASSTQPAPAPPKPGVFAPNQDIEILESLPPRAQSPISPPPISPAPIPKGLQGPPATPGRPGMLPQIPTPKPLPPFAGVEPGLAKTLESFSRASYGTPGAVGIGSTRPAISRPDPQDWRPPTLDQRLGYLGSAMEGLEEASAPYIIPVLAAGAVTSVPAAVTIGAGVVGGELAEAGTRAGMEYLGAGPGAAKLASKIAGWGPIESVPGYRHAVSGAAEALLPNSPTKQVSGHLTQAVEDFNQLVEDLGQMDPASPEYSQALSGLKAGEAQLGVAAQTLAQANLLGAIKSAQIMGKAKTLEEVGEAPGDMVEAPAPTLAPDEVDLTPAPPSAPSPEPIYKSSTTQYNLPESLAARVQYLGETIPESVLAPKGRESQPHLTIRYGIEDDPQVAIPRIRQALANQGPITVKLGETSIFPDSGDGEVLKIDLDPSPELDSIRQAISQSGVSHIPDKGDELGYSPHITVAYLKPGEGQGFVGPSPLTGREITIDRLWVGDRYGNQHEIPFGRSLEGILGPEQEAVRPLMGETPGPEEPGAAKFSIESRQLGPEHLQSKLTQTIAGWDNQALRPQDTRIPSYVKKLTKQTPRPVEIIDGKGEILQGWEIDITPEVRAKMSQPQPMFHVTSKSQLAQSPQLWTPEALSQALPGYKLDLLPNDPRTNPGGATIGLETPSGKWAKLVVTRGQDLPTSPADMANQLGRPARPDEVVMGQYASRGLREQSVITLSGAAGPETLSHELFHYAWDTFLTPQEQSAILQTYGSEEAAAVAYGQGKGGLPPGLSRLRQLFTQIRAKFYPTSQSTLEALRKGQIWERQARYGVDTREPVYRKPDGGLDWSLESMGKSFLETFDRNLVRFETNEPLFLAATLAAPGTSQSIAREAMIAPAQEIARTMQAGGYGTGSSQQAWRAFAEVLIDNRLAGVQGRWSDLATAVEKSTPQELRKALARHAESPDGPLARVLDRVEADQPMAGGDSRWHKTQRFLAEKDYPGAKAYLASLFRHNAMAVRRLDLKGVYGKRLDEFAQDPQFQLALQVYKSKLEPLMASHHLKNEGILSADLGPLDTYYPLVPQELGDAPLWQQSARQRGYWIRPHNPSNYFTTGLSTKGYDPDLATFRGRLTAVIRGGNTKQFLDVMRLSGLAVKVTDSSAHTATFRGGEELPVEVIPLGSAQSISVKGQALKIPPQYIAVPKALGPTVRSIVLGEGPGGSSAFHSESWVEDAVQRITGWSLIGPADAAFHAQAVLASLVAGTPYIRQSSAWKSFAANLPVAKAFTAMWQVQRRPASYFVSPEGSQKLLRMAQGGMLNPRIGGVAWDKDFAELFGAEWKPPIGRRETWRRTPEEAQDAQGKLGDAQGLATKAGLLGRKIASYLDVAARVGDIGTSALVFGHPAEAAQASGWMSTRVLGLDLRARLALYDLHTTLFPDAPLPDVANFVNQAMQYNWGLQSHLEQYIKGYAGTRLTSVFFTAGYSMIRAGVRAMNPVGTTHGLNRLDPIGQQTLARAQRAFTGGVTGMVGAWLLLNRASGYWPWEEDQPGGRVPFLHIKIPQGLRESAPGKALMGDPSRGAPRQGYVPMGFLNAAVWKGATALGVRPAVDITSQLGTQGLADPIGRQLIALEALRGSMNTFLHPLLSGPLPRAGLAAMGMSPWIGPMWDPITGRNQFTLRTESRAAESLFQAGGMAMARAAGQMSPAVNWLNESGMEIGLGEPLSGHQSRQDEGDAWAKTLADLMVPRSRPVGIDAKARAKRTRELVQKRKALVRKQGRPQ